jgi:hypothetical protein
MDGFQFDHVGVAIVTALVMFVTWYITQYLNCKAKKVAETQTMEVNTSCAQTETMRFTERLTIYGDKKVDLRDKFDKFCEIGNEAVGFCKMCEKCMCLNCCKHHEKIPLSESHVLLGKDEFKGLRNGKKMFDKSFTLFDNYCFQKNVYYRNSHYSQSIYDSNKQLLCLAQNIDDVWNSIGCFVQKVIADYELMLLWHDNKSRETKESSKLSGSHTPAGICTLRNTFQKSFGWFFTIPARQKIYKYTDKTCVEFFHTCGKCYGIAVFNEGLAISLNIPTKYSLPEWQVQFISYEGIVRKQICLDNQVGHCSRNRTSHIQ